jgi:hypothetical protein
MQSHIVVKDKEAVGKNANTFVEGTILRCVGAPSGYLYAVGKIAFKPKHYNFDKHDFVIQHDQENGLRVYSDEDYFYQKATFVEADKGVSITIEAL